MRNERDARSRGSGAEAWGISTSASLNVDGVRFETVEYVPGHWSERHAHGIPFIDLLLSGAQEARWNGEDVRRTPGTLSLMPIGEPHATDSVLPARTFQIAIDGLEGRKPITGPCAHLEVGPLAWHLTRMWTEFRQPDDLTPAVLLGRLSRFLDEVANFTADKGEARASWLIRAHDYVCDHARDGFGVSEVAAHVGVDPAHLMRTYAARYGVTLGEDARRRRVAYACRLLAQPGSSYGEIALAAGFADQSHLTRMFKTHTGLTPGEYRKMCLRA